MVSGKESGIRTVAIVVDGKELLFLAATAKVVLLNGNYNYSRCPFKYIEHRYDRMLSQQQMWKFAVEMSRILKPLEPDSMLIIDGLEPPADDKPIQYRCVWEDKRQQRVQRQLQPRVTLKDIDAIIAISNGNTSNAQIREELMRYFELDHLCRCGYELAACGRCAQGYAQRQHQLQQEQQQQSRHTSYQWDYEYACWLWTSSTGASFYQGVYGCWWPY